LFIPHAATLKELGMTKRAYDRLADNAGARPDVKLTVRAAEPRPPPFAKTFTTSPTR
jgi:hypothetical protein